MDKLVKCRTCGAEIAKTANRCPKCGAQQHIVAGTVCWLIFFALIAYLFVSCNRILAM